MLTELEKSPPQLVPEQLPRARFFETMGQIYMRSGAGLADTYCLFTCGGILKQHRHYDALNFVIYQRGFLALDSGTRYSEFENGQHLANYFAQTVAHNCVVIHQPDEPPARYWGGQVEGNHGGQHHQLGSVVEAFETNSDFVYVAGDATACYQHGAPCGEKCELATRQLVFLFPNHFIICDRVRTTQAEYRKQWLIHTAHEPKIDGQTFCADHNAGRMFCRTLLPRDAQLTAVGGPGREYLAAGQNWKLKTNNLKPENLALMGQWRVEVVPGTSQQDDVFLHVLQVGSQQMSTMDELTLVEDGTQCGVSLKTAKGTWKVIFATAGPLAGHIQRADGQEVIDRPFTASVQPQLGLMLQTRQQ